jgi:preprotein translocase SecF subunit
MGIRKPVFIATVVTALLGVGIFLARGRSSLNMDFIGGTLYTGTLNEAESIEELRKLIESEDRQKERLALERDPELIPEKEKERTWKLVYKEKVQDAPNEREIRMTETLTAAEMRQRAETLPEPSLELYFKAGGSNKSKQFTVRTTEKSPDLVAASLVRLLGDRLETTRMGNWPELVRLAAREFNVDSAKLSDVLNGHVHDLATAIHEANRDVKVDVILKFIHQNYSPPYTIKSVSLSFPKPVSPEQAKAMVLPPLRKAGLVSAITPKDAAAVSALRLAPLTGGALTALFDSDEITLGDFKDEGNQKGTYRNMTLTFTRTAPAGDMLLAALLPLTQANAEKKQEKQLDVQVQAATLNLSQHAFLSQVKALLDQRFRSSERQIQEVNVKKVDLGANATDEDRREEEEGRFKQMEFGLPTLVRGSDFKEAMDKFTIELGARPLPVRLENFDSALAASMQERALYAIVASWAAILLYLWFRFGNWTFGLAAVLCLIHDVCMTLGVIALAHYLHGSPIASALGLRDFKIDLTAVAALLTLIGFSVNDTIVVFDRIREVRGKNPQLTPEMINDSVNQTLSRTVLTSTTAWIVVLVLYIWGGEGVHLFAFVMVIGVIVGTMSSIFVASPLLLYLGEGAPRTQTAPQRIQERAETSGQ